MENDRRLFSRKDGTTFREDFPTFIGEVRRFVIGLPSHIKKVLPEAEDFVVAVEHLANALKDGEPLDLAIKKALEFIPGDVDSAVYTKSKQILSAAAMRLRIILDEINKKVEYIEGGNPQSQYSSAKRETAAILLQTEKLSIGSAEANLAVEAAVYYLYHA